MVHRIFLSLLLFLSLADSFGQLSDKRFTVYTTDNGLPDNAVVKVVSDKRKFLWIATRNGLSRFDGSLFVNYRLSIPAGNGLRSSWITDLLIDNTGKLWVSTEWGICFYDENTDRFNYVSSDVILYKAPMCLTGETLWAATENGIRKINTRTAHSLLISAPQISDPQSICSRTGGKIWIGTRGHGLFEYDTLQNKIRILTLPDIAFGEHIMNFFPDNNSLWIATGAGLVHEDGLGNTARYTMREHSLPADSVNALMFVTSFSPLTGDSMLLCGTYNKTAVLFNKRTHLFSAAKNAAAISGLPATIFNSAAVFSNALWLCTEKGLICWNARHQEISSFLLRSDDRDWSGCLIKKVLPCTDSAHAYLLTNSPSGVAVCDRRTGRIQKFFSLPGSITFENLVKNTNEILAVHAGGVDAFSRATGLRQIFRSPDHTLYSGMAEGPDRLWLGCDDGIILFDRRSGKSILYTADFKGTAVEDNSFPGKFLTAAITGDGKKLWLASLKYGLFSFDPATGIFTPYRRPSSAAYDARNRCRALQFDRSGTLWIGNFAGISAFDTAAKTFTEYSGAEGLASAYVYDIAVLENEIIGRGNSGIFYFDLRRKKFRNISLPAMMTGNVYNQRISPAGSEIFFGFEGGCAQLTPSAATAVQPPQTWITAFKVKNERRTIPERSVETKLSHTENTIELEWAAPEYIFAEDISYEYRLGNGPWIKAGKQRNALFTGLMPGNYEFSVRTVLPDGSAGQPAITEFSIRPPFWQTPLFIILSVLCLALILFWLYRIRISRLAREQNKNLDLLQRQFEIEEITSFFSTSLLDKRNPTEVLNGVAKDLIGRLGFDDCMIYVYSESTGKLEQTAGYGRKGDIGEKQNRSAFDLMPSQGLVGRCFTTGEPVLVNDTAKDKDYFTADGLRSGSELCIPFNDGSKIIGVINVEQEQTGFFTEQHLGMLNTIAVLVSTKITALNESSKASRKELELSEAANRITSAELALLRSRMNPHFIFNSLNSIQSYIWESKQEDAAEYLTKFARLMRMVLEHSNHKEISLAEELAALKLYIELEHRRSNMKFDYSISVDPGLDEEQTFVPPLIIQPFIENAIWHGMATMKEQGMLNVKVKRSGNVLTFEVEDNGIGREAAGKISRRDHESLGLEITRRRTALIGRDAAIEIIDKKKEAGMATGTKIIITLPLKNIHA